MFQSALIRRQSSLPLAVDAGALAETLLFYNSVHMVIDSSLLQDLLISLGPRNLISLIDEGLITVSYSRSIACVHTTTENYVPEYAFASIKLARHADKTRITTSDEIKEAVERVLGESKESRSIAKSLDIRFKRKEIGLGSAINSNGVIVSELSDPTMVVASIKSCLNTLVPSYRLPPNWNFIVAMNSEKRDFFNVVTSLDFETINRHYHKIVDKSRSSISPEFLLCHMLDARIDIDLASDYMAEIVTSEISSNLIQLRFANLLRRREINLAGITQFQAVHLNDGRAIREAINSGEKSFDDFLPILRKAMRFKQWLANRNPDSNLLREYYNATVAESWINRLPIKVFRYVFSTTLGLFNPIAGLAAGAADGILIEKILSGWRPNQFVEGPLRKFIF